MAVIDLFLQQTLRSNLGNFLALRAVNNSVLFDLPRAGHQLTEQRLILLAKRVFFSLSALIHTLR